MLDLSSNQLSGPIPPKIVGATSAAPPWSRPSPPPSPPSGSSSVRTMRKVRMVSGLPAATSMECLEALDEEIHTLSFRIIDGEHRLTNYRSVTSLHGELHSSMGPHFPMAEVLKCIKIGLICV
ncbi:hypothetical protein Taro_044966 [Colocasia esculenta]|uniref:Uncharacterized protein n=1 Tax=Colocasia esculenta TaxID=4460 RepID=A0A843X3I7_COLES|nr:hypothetical protein [Colocasia esculenta]